MPDDTRQSAEPGPRQAAGATTAKLNHRESQFLEALKMLIKSGRASTLDALIGYAEQDKQLWAAQYLKAARAQGLPLNLAYDALSAYTRIVAHKRNSNLLASCQGKRVGLVMHLSHHVIDAFASMTDVTLLVPTGHYLPPDLRVRHLTISESTREALKVVESIDALVFEAFVDGDYYFVDANTADVVELRIVPSSTTLIVQLRPQRNPDNIELQYQPRTLMNHWTRNATRLGLLFVLIVLGHSLDTRAQTTEGVRTEALSETDHPNASGDRDYSSSNARLIGFIMLAMLFAAFFAMTRYDVPLPLAMSLVACAFLGLQGSNANNILRSGFMHYADIVVLFTAVAIPAHMIERSQGFKWIASYFAHLYGLVWLNRPQIATPLLIFSILIAKRRLVNFPANRAQVRILSPPFRVVASNRCYSQTPAMLGLFYALLPMAASRSMNW